MDEADIAEMQEARSREAAIANARTGPAGLKPCGACHYCGEGIRAGLFCPPVDASGDGCARDYDALKAADRRNGVR